MSKQTIIESKFSKKKHYLRKIIKPWMSSRRKKKKAPKKYQLTQLHYILLHIYIYQSIKNRISVCQNLLFITSLCFFYKMFRIFVQHQSYVS